ncbi:hypothetical protein D1AOALGA4SA_7452 [Olavius algarvensis Delta 1 endosymbiont]|nr:hypothetical protein D1AOALGA4SA_7452 [Olavius algarvensis Delta 1 endosymbiont]
MFASKLHLKSNPKAISTNDMIVKDSDNLWRCIRSGFDIDVKRIGEAFPNALARDSKDLDAWFFTKTANKIAWERLQRRNEISAGCCCSVQNLKAS